MTDPSAASLLPVAVTLAVALSLRNVLVGLFSGVLVGALMLADVDVLRFLPTVIREYIVPEVADTYNASVLVLLAFIGGFVGLIEWSGGGAAFARSAVRFVTSKVRAELGAWFAGIAIFFSDLGTPLIVGPVFQPLADRLRLSRQKLAFVLDSTSSPVAILIPFIGWGVFIMSVIADAFQNNGLEQSEWDAFVAAIPFQVYAWLAIAIVPILAALRFDFGPMAKATAMPPQTSASTSAADVSKPIVVWLPLAVLGVSLFGMLHQLGFPTEQIAGSDFRAGLAAAYLLAAATLIGLLLLLRLRPLADVLARYVQGMSGMLPIAATLVLAWTLGAMSEALGTGSYVAEVARDGVSGALLPAVVFVLAALVSFATGSSWGTIVIMMPLAVPAAVATGAPLPVTIGAVLSGGLFGDHSSPVSETTLLSSTGAGTTPLAHFSTQLPYALLNGSIAILSFIVAGATGIVWIVPLAIAAQLILLLALRRLLGGRAD